MKRFSVLAACSCTLLLAGCALLQSPAVGDWSGTMTAAPQGGAFGALAAGMLGSVGGTSAQLTLRADGTGYIKAMSAPERPITWKADGDRIIIYGASDGKNATGSQGIVAKLSADKKTLSLDLGPVQFSLTKTSK